MLSILTIAEGGLGLLLTTCVIILVPFHYATLNNLEGRPYPHSLWLLYLLASASAVFDLMLLGASVSLWKLQRRGLVALICVLIAEFVCVLCIIFSFSSRVFSQAQSYMMGMGLIPFSPQIVTAFPIVAGILIFFAYRYLGIPARPIE